MPKTLTVDELIVGDASGQHLRFTSNELYAHDKNGRPRIHLMIENGGSPYFALHDGNGNARIALGVDVDGSTYLTLYDGNHTPRLELKLDPDDSTPSFTVSDSAGQPLFILGLDHTGKIALAIPGDNHDLVPWVPPFEIVA